MLAMMRRLHDRLMCKLLMSVCSGNQWDYDGDGIEAIDRDPAGDDNA